LIIKFLSKNKYSKISHQLLKVEVFFEVEGGGRRVWGSLVFIFLKMARRDFSKRRVERRHFFLKIRKNISEGDTKAPAGGLREGVTATAAYALQNTP
jgi:hypothetical protein